MDMIEENQEHEGAAPPAEDPPARPRDDEQSDEGFDEEALAEILAEDQLIEDEFLSSGDEDEEEMVEFGAAESPSEPAAGLLNGTSENSSDTGDDEIRATRDEL
jgi:hypothetical protein